MKKTILTTSIFALFASAVIAEDLNITSSDLTAGARNYIAIDQSTDYTISINGTTANNTPINVQRLYIANEIKTGSYEYGNLNVSVENLTTSRLALLCVNDAGSSAVSLKDITYNVASSVSTGEFYSVGQYWYGGIFSANSTNITFNGNASAYITAGAMVSNNSSFTMKNGTSITMNDANATASWMYVGGYAQHNATLNVYGGTKTIISAGGVGNKITHTYGEVFGGAYSFTGANVSINGGSDIKITGGDFSNTRIYGGNSVESSNGFIDSTSVDVSGVTAKRVYGGSRRIGSGESNVVLGKEGSTSTVSQVKISNATVLEGVYGAGVQDTVNGNIEITIGNGANVNNVYGGGSNSTVNGNTNITIMGNASVSGIISGGEESEGVVSGNKNLFVKEFFGSALNVSNFDKIEISADSKVEFANAFDVDTLVVEVSPVSFFSLDSQVSLADGTTFDTLTLVGDFEQNQINLNTVFGDSAGVVLSALEEKNTALTVIDSNGQEWATENLSSENGILSFEKGAAIPEPSTYAAIIGALALAFAVYRRRK